MRRFGTTMFVAAAAVVSIAMPAAGVTLPEEVTLDLSASPVEAGAMVGGQTVTAQLDATEDEFVVATPAGIFNCTLNNYIEFQGSKAIATGRFAFGADSACDIPVQQLQVAATLQKNGSGLASTPTSNCSLCTAAATLPRTHDCFFCAGTWRTSSQHLVEFPAGSILVDFDRGRCSALSLHVVSCTVLSGKIKI